jgi:hypothetical protein
MKHTLILLLFSCAAWGQQKNKQFDFVLFYNGADTIYKSGADSSYRLCLLPVINNTSEDTVNFIRSIYGRYNRPESFNIYPKYGINIYQNNKKIDFSFMRGCGNWGYLSKEAFVTVNPGKLMLPFKDSYKAEPNFDFTIGAKIPVTGEIEIEAYYNSLDTNQQNYHPFTDKEMKMGGIVAQDYNDCRELFKKLPHVYLKSNRIKVVLR